jgi:hypothetical protein
MFKRSDGKRRRKSRSKRSKRCRSLLGKKIGINIHEGIYANKAQAIAVAYSQVRKKHPSCRRILRSKKSRKSKRRSIRRKINDGVQGSGENGYLTPEEQNAFKDLFTLNANGIYEPKLFATFKFNDEFWGTGIVEFNRIFVSIEKTTTMLSGDKYAFIIYKIENPDIEIQHNVYTGFLEKVINYVE